MIYFSRFKELMLAEVSDRPAEAVHFAAVMYFQILTKISDAQKAGAWFKVDKDGYGVEYPDNYLYFHGAPMCVQNEVIDLIYPNL